MAIRFAPEKAKPVIRKSRTPDSAKRKRGGGRPKSVNPKAVLNIRVDPDVLLRWKGSGKGWQARIGEVLRTNAP